VKSVTTAYKQSQVLWRKPQKDRNFKQFYLFPALGFWLDII